MGNVHSGFGGTRAFRTSVMAALAGGVLSAAGAIVAPDGMAASYLAGYAATVAVVLGMLLLIMIAQTSGATWFVVLRRQAEAVVGALPVLALLTLPLLIFPTAFWPRAGRRNGVNAYLQPEFIVARSVVYWAAWLFTGELLRRISRRQDAGDQRATDQLNTVSIAALPFVGLALAFAAVDWMMSLSPGWGSSAYGVYYFAGAMVSAFGLLAFVAFIRRPTIDVLTRDSAAPTAEHMHALGKLTLAFVLFWGYIWYSQYFIVWIAGIPQESQWYLARLHGAWRHVAAAVLVCGFLVPFLVLLPRIAKRSFLVMGILGVWLLAAHYLDVYWLVVPDRDPDWSPLDLLWNAAALALMAGSATAAALWRQTHVPPVPVGDPRLAESLRYESR